MKLITTTTTAAITAATAITAITTLTTAFAIATTLASTPAQAQSQSEVRVYMPDHSELRLPAPSFKFSADSALSTRDTDALRSYITSNAERLGVTGNVGFHLRLAQQSAVGSRRFVRFEQAIERRTGNAYYVPVRGASIVAIIENGQLTRLNNNLMTPETPNLMTRSPGFEFLFSDTELAAFLMHLKKSPERTASMRAYFNMVARLANLSITFENFLNRQLSEQRAILNQFFGSIGSRATSRMLIDMGRHRQLSLVRYGNEWMYQVTGFFGLPVQFDIQIPSAKEERLRIKNLRELRTGVSINAYTSRFFPAGKKVPGGPQAERAAAKMQNIVQYFQDHFGWTSYSGQKSDKSIEVHTAITGADFNENASWLNEREMFIIGEGGPSLQHLESSLAVLGHEYAHALVQFSSDLIYAGQSGAINEHFADIQGATIEAAMDKTGTFSYALGPEVLTEAALKEKEKLLELMLQNKPYSPEEEAAFGLNKIGLRHLYAPAFSFATQLDHADAVRAAYPDDCQPSIDNDNCGVHSASGVPNKAAALIINKLGVEATRSLFFNTVINRLNQHSTFKDYLVQLYDECKETPAIASRCDIVLESFAAVGVNHPDPSKNVQPAAKQRFALTEPTHVKASLTASAQSASPSLRFCGWVDRGHVGKYQLIDGKFDALVIVSGNELKTRGDSATLNDLECACVTGRLTQLPDTSGKLFNAFLDIARVEDAGSACSAEARLRDLKPVTPATKALPPSVSGQFCGWVSVDSTKQEVAIIDNRYNATINATTLQERLRARSSHEYSKAASAQCACVTGVVEATAKPGNKLTHAFTDISKVENQPVEKCAGIKWGATE